MVVGWAGYIASRLAITRVYGVSTDTGALGLKLALDQFNNFPAGVWTALEGGWLLVFAATVILLPRQQCVLRRE